MAFLAEFGLAWFPFFFFLFLSFLHFLVLKPQPALFEEEHPIQRIVARFFFLLLPSCMNKPRLGVGMAGKLEWERQKSGMYRLIETRNHMKERKRNRQNRNILCTSRCEEEMIPSLLERAGDWG